MFFLWPTINAQTLSSGRRESNLRDLESRMDAFLIAKAARANPQIIERVRRSRADIRNECRKHRAGTTEKHDIAV